MRRASFQVGMDTWSRCLAVLWPESPLRHVGSKMPIYAYLAYLNMLDSRENLQHLSISRSSASSLQLHTIGATAWPNLTTIEQLGCAFHLYLLYAAFSVHLCYSTIVRLCFGQVCLVSPSSWFRLSLKL